MPAQQPTQHAVQPLPQTTCPSGVVTSGLVDVHATNERYTTVAGVSTMADMTGHGVIHNGTTAPVFVTSWAPSVKGLDANGMVTTYLDTEFEWKPAPGQPRPPQITLLPGQDLTYSVKAKEVPSGTIRATKTWYVDPSDSVDYYSDFRTYADCEDVKVSALPNGSSVINNYVPWGQ